MYALLFFFYYSIYVLFAFQVNQMNDENRRLREKLSLITTQVKALPGGACLAMSVSDVASPPRTKIVPLSGRMPVV